MSSDFPLPCPRAAILIAGGGFLEESLSLVRRLEQHCQIILLTSADCHSVVSRMTTHPVIAKIDPFMLRSQRGLRRLAAIPRAYLQSLTSLSMHKPDAVICVGSAMALPLFMAAAALGIKTAFIESITRVHAPSRTARLLQLANLTDQIYVQWPQLTRRLHGSRYEGNLL